MQGLLAHLPKSRDLAKFCLDLRCGSIYACQITLSTGAKERLRASERRRRPAGLESGVRDRLPTAGSAPECLVFVSGVVEVPARERVRPLVVAQYPAAYTGRGYQVSGAFTSVVS